MKQLTPYQILNIVKGFLILGMSISFEFESDEKVKEEMNFEEAKYFLMKNLNKIDYARIESEEEFSKEEFALLSFFESFEYYTKNISISSTKNYSSSFDLENIGSFSIYIAKDNSAYLKRDIYSEKFMEKLVEYKNCFPYIFNKNGIENKFKNKTLHLKRETNEWIFRPEGLFIISNENMSVMEFFAENFKEKKGIEKRECKGKELTINFGKGMYFSSFKINFEENKIVLYHYLECGREFVYDLKTRELTAPSLEEEYSITEIETFFLSFGKTFEKLIEKSEKAINQYISNDLSFYTNSIRKKNSEIKTKAETDKLSEMKEKQEIDKKISERMKEI